MQIMVDINLTDTNTPRITNAIYLIPKDNKKGGNECIHLQASHVITGNNLKKVSVTDLFIKSVETMTFEQGIKTLKIQGKKKVPLHPID